jgi:hypothetical protein
MTQSTTEGAWSASGQASDQSTTDQVKDKVAGTAQAARERTGQVAGQARGRLSQQVDQRSTQAGQQVSGTADDVRSVAQELRNQGKETPARLAEQAADRAERLGTYLQQSDGDRILRDIEDFARRQPLAVAAAGLALGFAASRFLKASSSRRYGEGTVTGRRYTGGTAFPAYAEPSPSAEYAAGDYPTEYPATGSPASDAYVAPGPYERTYVTGAPTDAGTYEPRPVDPVDPVDPYEPRPGEPPVR